MNSSFVSSSSSMRPQPSFYVLLVLDAIFLYVVWGIQYLFGHGHWGSDTFLVSLIFVIILWVGLYVMDTYEPSKNHFRQISLIAITVLIFHLLHPFMYRSFDLSFSLAATVLSSIIGCAYHYLIRQIIFWQQFKRTEIQKVLLLGQEKNSVEMQHLIESTAHLETSKILLITNECMTENWQKIEEQIQNSEADILCVERNQNLPQKLKNVLIHLRLQGKDVLDFSEFCQREFGYIPLDFVEESWFLFVNGFDFQGSRNLGRLKRIIDIFLALLGLIFMIPVSFLLLLLNPIFNPGSLFYSQMRVGLYGKEFRMYKFRTMVEQAEKNGQAQWAQQNDQRTTPLGKILRKTHLDELPQILNVFNGTMSIVGPRPERKALILEIEKELSFYELRHFVKPGLTGWSQIHIHYADSILTTKWKLQYDLFYVRNLSIFFDILIIVKTIRLILFQKGR